MRIGIIGAGRLGTAVGTRLSERGHRIMFGGRASAHEAATEDGAKKDHQEGDGDLSVAGAKPPDGLVDEIGDVGVTERPDRFHDGRVDCECEGERCGESGPDGSVVMLLASSAGVG